MLTWYSRRGYCLLFSRISVTTIALYSGCGTLAESFDLSVPNQKVKDKKRLEGASLGPFWAHSVNITIRSGPPKT